jgi:hypothetical protein
MATMPNDDKPRRRRRRTITLRPTHRVIAGGVTIETDKPLSLKFPGLHPDQVRIEKIAAVKLDFLSPS